MSYSKGSKGPDLKRRMVGTLGREGGGLWMNDDHGGGGE